jgi:hypothetical protein
VNADGPDDEWAKRFARNWLMFDERRPTRPRLLRNFIAVVAACLIATALLAILSR